MKKRNLIIAIYFMLLIASNIDVIAQNNKKPISKLVEKEIKKNGIDSAIGTYKSVSKEQSIEYDLELNQLSELGWKLLKKEKKEEALKVFNLNSEVFPDSALVFYDLVKAYYAVGDKANLKQSFKKLLEIEEPKDLNLVILKKRLFFISDDFVVPEIYKSEKYILKPLKTTHAEMDYEAIMSSVDHLSGVLGGTWPAGLTLEEDRKVLKMHEGEFNERSGFVFTVLNHEETKVLGCVYLYPSRLDDYDAEVIVWVTKSEYDNGLDSILFTEVDVWLKESWPFEKMIYPGRKISWGEFYNKLDKQDQKYIQ